MQQLEDGAAAAVLSDDAQRPRVQTDAVELHLGMALGMDMVENHENMCMVIIYRYIYI